jgi:hypothetical protein
MLTLKPKKFQYTHSVDIFDLPKNLQTAVRDHTVDNSDSMLDYSDGDYYFPIDFRDLIPDPTPAEEVKRFLDEELDAADYPYADWHQYRDDFDDYLQLRLFELAVQFIKDNVPADVVEANTVAIYCWH